MVMNNFNSFNLIRSVLNKISLFFIIYQSIFINLLQFISDKIFYSFIE